MLFNSAIFILLFLPITIGVYFTLNRYHLILAGKAWLVLASLFFYGWWNPSYLILIFSSMLVNFALGSSLQIKKERQSKPFSRKLVLVVGVSANLLLLGYFKYADFFLSSFSALVGAEYGALRIMLPLAISFFTFQQIAYLVDCYKEDTLEYDFLNYSLFVCFFPQLIAGPIVHHKEMMPQFYRPKNYFIQWNNVAAGLFVFSIGLFKKVYVADNFAVWANLGYANSGDLSFFDAWAATLSYTLQLYYDFSGYTDMAIGAALMLNIRLPLNFNSPHKAVDIQDFWRRWHITLSRWLRDYVYIPLGGNRKGPVRTYLNLFTTFLLGGLWHGAGWTFVIWGAMHGIGTSIHKFWSDRGLKMPRLLGWLVTFLFVHFALVFFRAESIAQASTMFANLFGQNGFTIPMYLAETFPEVLNTWGFLDIRDWDLGVVSEKFFIHFLLFALIAFLAPNSMQLLHGKGILGFRFTWIKAVLLGVLLAVGMTCVLQSTGTEFLYFNF